eukprot:TRINITY_DN19789_c1_g2_i1.p1 TRINITY_DN19789_c1_g2~~TRINITY_DN19789_c1_g2_i1.p1  ORF type:complete len:642 (+),score=187.19 TRINITY_DN19789_c1_g2_i1:81-1928(+)
MADSPVPGEIHAAQHALQKELGRVGEPEYVHDASQQALVEDHAALEGLDKRAQIAKAFAALDTDGSGMLSPEEVMEGLVNVFPCTGVFQVGEWVQTLVRECDANWDGQLSVEEVLNSSWADLLLSGGMAAAESQQARRFVEVCAAMGQSVVTRTQLTELMAKAFPTLAPQLRTEYCNQLVRRADVDGDGAINLDEFLKSTFKHLLHSAIDPDDERYLRQVEAAEALKRGWASPQARSRPGSELPRPGSAPRCRSQSPLLDAPPKIPDRLPYVERLCDNALRPTGKTGEGLPSKVLLERAEAVLHKGGDWRDALDCFRDAAAQLAEEGNAEAGAAGAWVRSADCHRALREPECAAAALSNAGEQYRRGGMLREAAVALTAAIQLYEELGLQGKAAALNRDLSDICVTVGDVTTAQAASAAAWHSYLAKGQRRQAVRQARRTAELALMLRDYETAQRVFDSLAVQPTGGGQPAALHPLRHCARCPDGERAEYHLAALLCRLAMVQGSPGETSGGEGVRRVALVQAAEEAMELYEQESPDWRPGNKHFDVGQALLDAVRRPQCDGAPQYAIASKNHYFQNCHDVPAWTHELLEFVCGSVKEAQERSAEVAMRLSGFAA